MKLLIILFPCSIFFATNGWSATPPLSIYVNGSQAKALFTALHVAETKVAIPPTEGTLGELQIHKMGENVLCVLTQTRLEGGHYASKYFCSLEMDAHGKTEATR